jgi:hypothetical protein
MLQCLLQFSAGSVHVSSNSKHTLRRGLRRRGRLAVEDVLADRAMSVESEGLVMSRGRTRWDSPRPYV